MSVEMFLRLDGVTGGSRNYQHRGWADLVAWRWNLDQAVATAAGGAGAGVQMNEIVLDKHVGVESTDLMRLFAEGATVPKAEISVVPVVGKRDAPQKYLAITLEDVTVRSLRTSGSVEDPVFKETLTLRFARVRYEFHHYTDQVQSGGAPAMTSYAFTWNLATGAAV